MVAVCPVEHDMTASESGQTWIEARQEAEQKALAANAKMSILNTDLVFGDQPSHMIHYMTQCAFAGKIQQAFTSEAAKFKPVGQSDLTKAIASSMDSNLTGQFALRGSEEVSSRQLLNLIEQSCHLEAGATKAKKFEMTKLLEEFLVGMGSDTNMAEMIQFFEDNQGTAPVTGDDFWTATGSSADQSLSAFFEGRRVAEDDPSLLLPTFGSYKFNMAD